MYTRRQDMPGAPAAKSRLKEAAKYEIETSMKQAAKYMTERSS